MHNENLHTTEQEQNSRNYSDSLISRVKIKKSPFTLVTVEEGSFLALGKHMITGVMEKEEIEKMLQETQVNWELLIPIIGILVNELKNELKNEKQ